MAIIRCENIFTPDDGHMYVCSGGNCCWFAVTAYVVPLVPTRVVIGVSCVLPLVLCCLFRS
jgi:hypothetical protein